MATNGKSQFNTLVLLGLLKIKIKKRQIQDNSLMCAIHGGCRVTNVALAGLSVLLQSKVIVKMVHSNSFENN